MSMKTFVTLATTLFADMTETPPPVIFPAARKDRDTSFKIPDHDMYSLDSAWNTSIPAPRWTPCRGESIADNNDGSWSYIQVRNNQGYDAEPTVTVADDTNDSVTARVLIDALPVTASPNADSFFITENVDSKAVITQQIINSHRSDVVEDVMRIFTMPPDTPEAGSHPGAVTTPDNEQREFEPSFNSEAAATLTSTIRDENSETTGQTDVTANALVTPLNAIVQGYAKGLYKLNLDLCEFFPEQDGSKVYSPRFIYRLNGLPEDVQLLSGGEVIWSSGDGDYLSLTRDQALGLTDIFLRSQDSASFDIVVWFQIVDKSTGHGTYYSGSTVHYEILDQPNLATYTIRSTSPNTPDVYKHPLFPSESKLTPSSYAPVLFNNAAPSDGAIIDEVDWQGDARNTIEVEGFSTEFNHRFGYKGNEDWAYPDHGQGHGALFDMWMFRWSMDDVGKTDPHLSPRLRTWYGDQTMQVVAHNVQNDIDFFEARSVLMGSMHDLLELHPESPHPDYLRADWDERVVFGHDSAPDTLSGAGSHDFIGPGPQDEIEWLENMWARDSLNNILVGFGGDDTLIYNGKGYDTLLGGDGNDALRIQSPSRFIDSYSLTDFVNPVPDTNIGWPGKYGNYTVVEGKIDGGNGYDILELRGGRSPWSTLYLNYAEHRIDFERNIDGNIISGPNSDLLSRLLYAYYQLSHELKSAYRTGEFTPSVGWNKGETYGNYASFKYNMINIEEININGPNTLNLNLANVWLVTSAEYDKTLYVTGNSDSTLEIRDQANWHYVGLDDNFHHLVSTTGLAHLYVHTAMEIHAVGDKIYNDTGKVIKHFPDSLHVDELFHTALAGGGKDTVTIDSSLFDDGRVDGTDFTCIDGGKGFDTLKLGVNHALSNNVELDLTAMDPNQLNKIEAIDIAGNTRQANTLVLSAASVIDVTDADNVLYVEGDPNDTVRVTDADSWSHTGTSEKGGLTYDHYTFIDGVDTTADLYIQAQMLTNMGHV